MRDFVLRVKRSLAARLDRDGLTFRTLKAIYGRFFAAQGRREWNHAVALRKEILQGDELANVIVLKQGMAVEFRDGRRYVYDPRDPADLLSIIVRANHGEYEGHLGEFCRGVFAEGDVALDIGANFGWFTVLFSRLVGKAGQVHAFEPVPATHEKLKANLVLNGAENVRPVHAALGEHDGTVPIHVPRAYGSTFASVIPDYASDAKNSDVFEVPMTSVDAYAAAHALARVDFVKCDVEGYEAEVFRGAKQTLLKNKPLVMAEVNGEKDDRSIFDFFKEIGFAPFYFSEGSLKSFEPSKTGGLPEINFFFIPPERMPRVRQFLK